MLCSPLACILFAKLSNVLVQLLARWVISCLGLGWLGDCNAGDILHLHHHAIGNKDLGHTVVGHGHIEEIVWH